jgi:N-acetylglucosaminyldiphosphoundecaprenol N-acetyl-beta-D-mannosaminyltransferase
MNKFNNIEILGVKVNQVNKKQTLNFIKKTIKQNRKAQIATVNPEFIVEAQTNQQFKRCLNNLDLSVADGVGIKAAAKYNALSRSKNKIIKFFQSLFQGLFLIGPAVVFNRNWLDTGPEIIPGSNLAYDIADLANKNNFSIYLLGAREGIAKLAGKKLKKLYPELSIAGSYAGSPAKKEENLIIKKIKEVNPDILLVAYGAPAQDLWIKRNLNKFKKPLVAMGVGGTFDFISGYKDLEKKIRIYRAPKFFQKLGLEWLYRLIQEPNKRIKRIWVATVIFPWLVWKNSILDKSR